MVLILQTYYVTTEREGEREREREREREIHREFQLLYIHTTYLCRWTLKYVSTEPLFMFQKHFFTKPSSNSSTVEQIWVEGFKPFIS